MVPDPPKVFVAKPDPLDTVSDRFRILKLTLSHGPYEATACGQKKTELRKDSNWIRSRLCCTKRDIMMQYDYIEYYHGGGFYSWCPMVRVKFVTSFWYPGDVSLGPYQVNNFAVTFTGGC